jgi:hypothetical protein
VGARDSIWINGVEIRLHGSFEREVVDDSGATVAELEAVVIVRGRMPNKQFMQLIARDQVQLDLENGGQAETMQTRIGNHSAVATGNGEGTIYRHDILFRELPESYKRRQAERAAAAPAPEAPRPSPRTSTAEPEPVDTLSELFSSANTAAWGTALQQMKGGSPKSLVVEEPLTLPELAAIETVLINLRVEALIDQLEGAGLLRRGAVDERFHVLLEQRFVAEAIPLVGEKTARRAARDVLANQP